MLRYFANLKAIRYESTSLKRIVADKSHRVIVAYVTALCDQRDLVTCDVTDEGFPITIFGKRVKPRMDPAVVPDFEGRYLKNEKRFFKNNFETVF